MPGFLYLLIISPTITLFILIIRAVFYYIYLIIDISRGGWTYD